MSLQRPAPASGLLSFELLLADPHLRTSLADPGVLRAVLGGGLYLTTVALFGLGLGAALRSSTGATATLLGLLLIPPLLLELSPPHGRPPQPPTRHFRPGSAIVAVHHDPSSLGPWAGFALFCAYALLALTAGFILINHRDATHHHLPPLRHSGKSRSTTTPERGSPFSIFTEAGAGAGDRGPVHRGWASETRGSPVAGLARRQVQRRRCLCSITPALTPVRRPPAPPELGDCESGEPGAGRDRCRWLTENSAPKGVFSRCPSSTLL